MRSAVLDFWAWSERSLAYVLHQTNVKTVTQTGPLIQAVSPMSWQKVFLDSVRTVHRLYSCNHLVQLDKKILREILVVKATRKKKISDFMCPYILRIRKNGNTDVHWYECPEDPTILFFGIVWCWHGVYWSVHKSSHAMSGWCRWAILIGRRNRKTGKLLKPHGTHNIVYWSKQPACGKLFHVQHFPQ